MTLRPTNEAEVAEAIRTADGPLEIRGGGSRMTLGAPVQAARTLDISGLSGVSLYEPGALTLVAGAGTPLAEIEALLAAENQRLAFEPMDHRALLGQGGEPTIGGVAACNVSGPRRVQAGACRDSMIGVRFVDGAGRAVKNGGRVMKNVTGYDLVKLMAGSYGSLGVLTEVAFKLLPAPEASATLAVRCVDDAGAVRAMSAALTSPYDVTGAAYLPGRGAFIRIEGLAGSVAYRAGRLTEVLAKHGEVTPHDDADLWPAIRDARGFADAPGAVWRLSLRPSDAPGVVALIAQSRSVRTMFDWGGGLVWLLTGDDDDAGATAIRAAVAGKGHATLVRAPAAIRAQVPPFQPEAAALTAISRGLRARFDPRGILNPGRMGA
ncbi:MAG: glycolate oxidase FAD binding subunit [Paracoccaceae bacterium]